MLFAERHRDDLKPKSEAEGDLAFLNRSALPGIARVREFLSGCVSRYPAGHRSELISRMRSGTDANWRSATFELLLHEGLYRLGFKLDPHPTLSNGVGTRPDFMVSRKDEQSFYLEAVNAGEDDGRDDAAERRKAVTLEALARGQHPRFMVSVESDGNPRTQPSGRRLLAEVLRWLDGLNVDDVQRSLELQQWDALPSIEWKHEDWVVTVKPIPLTSEHQGKPGPLLGVTSLGASWVDTRSPICEAIRQKGGKYGDLGLPLIVAVNSSAWHLEDRDVEQALFGRVGYHFNPKDLEAEPRADRARDGAWIGPSGPRTRRVSGAWVFNDLTPYQAASRQHLLYLHPWALHPVPGSLLDLPHARLSGRALTVQPGRSLRDLFGLQEGWPA